MGTVPRPSAACPRGTVTSSEDAVAVAPSNEDIDGPNTRPIHARGLLKESSPKALHSCGVEPGGSNGLRIPQGLIHGVL